MPERRDPTHRLVVEVPLNVHESDRLSFNPVEDAMRIVLAVSRAAFQGYICDEIAVRLDEVADDEGGS